MADLQSIVQSLAQSHLFSVQKNTEVKKKKNHWDVPLRYDKV